MSNELRLLKAFIEAQGYEIEENHRYLQGNTGGQQIYLDSSYKVTKKKAVKKIELLKLVYPLAFADFWLHYPRKEKKPNALSAFTKLSHIDQSKAITDCKTRYKQVENKKYIPLPASYLNAHSFNDDPLPNQKELSKEQKLARVNELKQEEWARTPDGIGFKPLVTFAKAFNYKLPDHGMSVIDYRKVLIRQINERIETKL